MPSPRRTHFDPLPLVLPDAAGVVSPLPEPVPAAAAAASSCSLLRTAASMSTSSKPPSSDNEWAASGDTSFWHRIAASSSCARISRPFSPEGASRKLDGSGGGGGGDMTERTAAPMNRNRGNNERDMRASGKQGRVSDIYKPHTRTAGSRVGRKVTLEPKLTETPKRDRPIWGTSQLPKILNSSPTRGVLI